MRKTIPAQVVIVCDRCNIEGPPGPVNARVDRDPEFSIETIGGPLDLCDECAKAVRAFVETHPARITKHEPLPAGFKLVATDNPCLKKLKDGEPYFVLRAQDRIAAAVVRYWAEKAKAVGSPDEKWQTAMDVALEFDTWAKVNEQKTPD